MRNDLWDSRQFRIIFIAALLTRIVVVFLTGPTRIGFGDAGDYLNAARSLCETLEYPERGHLPFIRPPFYPFFIAVFTFCKPGLIAWIKLLQALIDSFSVLLLLLLGKRLFSNTSVPYVAAAIAAFYPPLVYHVVDVQTETLFTFLFLASVLLLFCAYQERKLNYFMMAGLVFGLAALTRPVVLSLLPFVFLWFLLASPNKRNAIGKLGILFIFFLLPVLPWSLRNYMKFHEWILISNEGGYAFWRDNNELGVRLLRTKDPAEYERLARLLNDTKTKEYDQQIRERYPSLKDQEKEWYRLGFEYVRNDPWRWIQLCVYKWFYFWRPWVNPATYSRNMVILSVLIFGFIYSLGLAGLIRTYSERKREVQFFLILFFCVALLHSFFLPSIRKRVTLVDPYMILFASSTLVQLFGRRKTGKAYGCFFVSLWFCC